MQNKENKTEEIDLYSIIEVLWSSRFLILRTIFVFTVGTAVVLFFSNERSKVVEDNYITNTVVYAPNDTILQGFSGKIRGREILALDGITWLAGVANAVDSELLRSTYEWAMDAGSPMSDWLSTDQRNTLYNDQQFYEFSNRFAFTITESDEFSKRVVITSNNGKDANLENQKSVAEEKGYRRPKLTITFVSDNPIPGAEISQNIIKLAQEKAFEIFKIEYVNNIYSLLDEEDMEVFAEAEKLYVNRIAEKINEQEGEDLAIKKLIAKFRAERVLGTKIWDATQIERDFYVKDKKNTLDNEILNLVEQMRRLREKHTHLVLARERDNSFLPNVSPEDFIQNGSSVTETLPATSWYTRKNNVRDIVTAAFFGLVVGIILALIMDGLEKRRSIRSKNK